MPVKVHDAPCDEPSMPKGSFMLVIYASFALLARWLIRTKCCRVQARCLLISSWVPGSGRSPGASQMDLLGHLAAAGAEAWSVETLRDSIHRLPFSNPSQSPPPPSTFNLHSRSHDIQNQKSP